MGYPRYSMAIDNALSEINKRDLHSLLNECRMKGSITPLNSLPFQQCGDYVYDKFVTFNIALRKATSTAKVKNRPTDSDLIRAAMGLTSAVAIMTSTIEEAKQNLDSFVIGRESVSSSNNNVIVTIPFKWRLSPNDNWVSSHITYHHVVDISKPLSYYDSRTKLSSSKAESKERARIVDKIASETKHIIECGKESIHHYLKKNGDGSNIPIDFTVIRDPHFGGINNHCTNFSPDC